MFILREYYYKLDVICFHSVERKVEKLDQGVVFERGIFDLGLETKAALPSPSLGKGIFHRSINVSFDLFRKMREFFLEWRGWFCMVP